jgi:hypothetical protein
MSRIGEGKPMQQTVVLRQDAAQLLQQFTIYGHSTDGYVTVQTGPMELTFTRTFWPTSYIIVAVVGFFLCLIGPLILLMNQQEMFTITLKPGTEPGTTEVTVSGVVDKDMMLRLMTILGQGTFQASSHVGTVSPDGHYRWDGTAWQPNAATPAPQTPPTNGWSAPTTEGDEPVG